MADAGQAILNLLRGGSSTPDPSSPANQPQGLPQQPQSFDPQGYPIAPPYPYAFPAPIGGVPAPARPPMSREQSLLAILQNAPTQQQPSYLPAQDTNAALTDGLRSLLSIGPSSSRLPRSPSSEGSVPPQSPSASPRLPEPTAAEATKPTPTDKRPAEILDRPKPETDRVPQSTPAGVRLTSHPVHIDVGSASPPYVSTDGLPVQAITLVSTKMEYRRGTHIAVNAHFIAYGVKGARIRVLAQQTGNMVLIKDASGTLLNLAITQNRGQSYLASTTLEGCLRVWKLQQAETNISCEPLFATEDSAGIQWQRVRWCTDNSNLLAVSNSAKEVRVLDMRQVLAAGKVDFDANDIGLVTRKAVAVHDADINDLELARNGTDLRTACNNGSVYFWRLSDLASLSGRIEVSKDPVDSIMTANNEVLITGSGQNRLISVFDMVQRKLVQTVRFYNGDSRPTNSKDQFNRIAFSRLLNSLVVVNSARNSLYLLHLNTGASDRASTHDRMFNYLVEYPLPDSTIDLVAVDDSANARCGAYCVQTKTVQQFVLALDHAWPAGASVASLYVNPPAPEEPIAEKKSEKDAVGLENGEILGADNQAGTDDASKTSSTVPARPSKPLPRTPTPTSSSKRPPSRSKNRPNDVAADSPVQPVRILQPHRADSQSSLTSNPDHQKSGEVSKQIATADSEVDPPGPSKSQRDKGSAAVKKTSSPMEMPAPLSDGSSSSTQHDARFEQLLQRMEKLESAVTQRLTDHAELQKNREQQQQEALLNGVREITKALSMNLSASVNRDLQKSVRANLDAQWKSVETKITESVQHAMTRPELVEAVSSSLIGSLTGVLEASFKESFATVLIPRMQSAVTTMFTQIHETMEAGLGEYFQVYSEKLDKQQPTVPPSIEALVERISSFQPDVIVGRAMSDLQNSIPQTVEKEIRRALSVQDMQSSVRRQSQDGKAVDNTAEILGLTRNGKYEEAFTKSLSLADSAIVMQLCRQIDPKSVFLSNRSLLSQPVILSLMHQISADLNTETSLKLQWLEDLMMNVNKRDPVIAQHTSRILPIVSKRLAELVQKDPTGTDGRTAKMLVMMLQGLFQ
ncbi:enhancer of mRNA decapping 4 [Rhizophlyctis rosea]|uniref:Enhancer of mRNA decapping 4 n=1 Tax=Rhizophlyctis rosea TaxID=64517 RepID=A0AAD5SHP7_9FUNG|nr:enhancer of mRNA decapping 4 [Rhizophlyctis rosea]